MNLSSRVALSIHAYYMDVFEAIIVRIPPEFNLFDIYVTCNEENSFDVASLLEKYGIESRLHVCDNRGMDVVPFLEGVREFELHKYTSVVKLHTKNNKDAKGLAIATEAISMLLADAETLFDLRNAFDSDPDLCIAGPDYFFKNAEFMMYNNRRLFTSVLRSLGLEENTEVGFFAGTMFWIRGAVLEPLTTHLPALLEKYDSPSTVSWTGGDGSFAHAVERIWTSLAPSCSTKVGLIYPADLTGRNNIVRVALQSDALHEPMRRSALSDLVGILPGSALAAQTVARSPLFDEEYYISRPGNAYNPGMVPALHYVRYGEPLGIRPSPGFCPSYYAAIRQDVARANINFLAHYTNFGKKEGVAANPSPQDWVNLARQIGFFDPDFYSAEFPGSSALHGSAEDHYMKVGRHLYAQPSGNFTPSSLPVLAVADGARDCMSRYMEDYRLDESARYHELARLVQNNDFVTLRRCSDEILALYGNTAPLQIAYALSDVAHGDIKAAGRNLEIFWNDLTSNRSQRRHIYRLTSYLRRLKETTEVWQKPEGVRTLGKRRVCVYTTLFGEIDNLPPVLSPEPCIDYICITDRPRSTKGWTFRICEPEFESLNLSAKIFKILPHRYLSDYDFSMFVDANTVIAGRLKEFVVNYLLDRDFAMWTHPERQDPYVEMCAIVEAERHAPAKLIAQMQDYRADGLPAGSEMYEASFIWRRHGHLDVVDFMEKWWEQILKYSERDQLSLSYLGWKTGYEPATIDSRFGTSRSNSIFFKIPHAKVKDPRPGNVAKNEVQPIILGGRPIHVLYSEKYFTTGSNVLRARQLSSLFEVATNEPVLYSPNEHIFNKIVIATKGYIADRGAEGLVALRKRGNVVLLDLIDSKATHQIVDIADGLIASSIQAVRQYQSAWVNKPCFHITHHVDFRLRGRSRKLDELKIGYFGESLNTIVNDEIAKSVDINHVDTSRIDLGWIDTIDGYNCHYAVRKARSIDGPKPFLKGFVAAAYRSNIIIQRDAGDAEYYLGADYPYLIAPQASSTDILDMMSLVSETYGGPEWSRGLLVMRDVRRRSSIDFVVDEIKHMLQSL